MNLKKIKIIGTISIFILCFIFHFAYQILPCTLTAIFFSFFESIWEHQKLLFSAVIFNGIIEYALLTKFNIKFKNFFTSLFISALTIIPIFLTIYLPLYYRFGPKMIINIGVMSISIIIVQILSYRILKLKNHNNLNKISFILIILSYIVFAYLTYYPIKNHLFLDTKEEKYGLNNYNV